MQVRPHELSALTAALLRVTKTADLHPETPWHLDPQPFDYVNKKRTAQEERRHSTATRRTTHSTSSSAISTLSSSIREPKAKKSEAEKSSHQFLCLCPRCFCPEVFVL